MGEIKHVGVIDIGKTNAKVAVVDLDKGTEIGVLKRPNKVLPGPPYPHYDVEGHWAFILDSLAQLHRDLRIDALSVTTHGACVVLLDENGGLAAPVLDYEFSGPDSVAEDYDAIRPGFAEIGSPRLGMGLNAGAQLFWQLKCDSELLGRIAAVLTYPQYWSYRLTGEMANEATSLGSHTDLWNPGQSSYSSLIGALGLADKMAPVKRAGDRLGGLREDLAKQTGLPAGLPVVCGIHDSNASLYPHLIGRKGAFSVVSTGTWVVAFAIGGDKVRLDPARDTLININAFGDPVPAGRFMGGREFDVIMKGHEHGYQDADIGEVLSREIMFFPAADPRSGPFQGRRCHWNLPEAELTDGQRYVALSFYLALVTAECLAMIGAKGVVVVEGPFAANRLFLRMLQAVVGRPVEASQGSVTGTSVGAALLVDPSCFSGLPAERVQLDSGTQPKWKRYAVKWQAIVAGQDETPDAL